MYLYKILQKGGSAFHVAVHERDLEGFKAALEAYERHWREEIEKEQDEAWHSVLNQQKDSIRAITFIVEIDVIQREGIISREELENGTDVTYGDDKGFGLKDVR